MLYLAMDRTWGHADLHRCRYILIEIDMDLNIVIYRYNDIDMSYLMCTDAGLYVCNCMGTTSYNYQN